MLQPTDEEVESLAKLAGAMRANLEANDSGAELIFTMSMEASYLKERERIYAYREKLRQARERSEIAKSNRGVRTDGTPDATPASGG